VSGASNPAGIGSPLGIIELGAVCAAMQARNLAVFEQLGGWVADTTEPALQQVFAEACHRHAWHAELWAQRAPVIAPLGLGRGDIAATEPIADIVVTADRAAAYTTAIGRLVTDTTALRARIDARLDPSTARTIDLVLSDLGEIRQRLAAASSS
jgi:hypothetical protein